jgi:hypothetical protein
VARGFAKYYYVVAASSPRAVHGAGQSYANSGILRRGMMSALGQKQTFAPQKGMSADIRAAKRHVRFAPESDIKCDRGECPLRAKSGHSAE